MRFHLPDGAFPRLELTDDIKQEIVELADQLIAETVRESEPDNSQQTKRRVSRKDWRLLHTNEAVQVYRSRKSYRSRPQVDSKTGSLLENSWQTDAHDSRLAEEQSSSASSHNEQQSSRRGTTASEDNADRDSDAGSSPEMVAILITGTLEGDVEDFALGSLAPSEGATRQRHSHIEDDYDDLRVLATIYAPTAADPFRYLGVKWICKSFKPFFKPRDFVYIESTGFTRDARGRRVSYRLSHSITLPEIPALAQCGVVRGEMATCLIAREHEGSLIDIYGRGIIEVQGNSIVDLATGIYYASTVSSVALTVDSSYSKKAIWLMRRAAQTKKDQSPAAKACDVCTKRFNVLKKLTQSSAMCQLCRRVRSICFCHCRLSQR